MPNYTFVCKQDHVAVSMLGGSIHTPHKFQKIVKWGVKTSLCPLCEGVSWRDTKFDGFSFGFK
jgi:hypothetical protein